MRYIARPAQNVFLDFDTDYASTADVIIEEVRGPEDTGLCDQYGRQIYRVPERRSVGFKFGSKA